MKERKESEANERVKGEWHTSDDVKWDRKEDKNWKMCRGGWSRGGGGEYGRELNQGMMGKRRTGWESGEQNCIPCWSGNYFHHTVNWHSILLPLPVCLPLHFPLHPYVCVDRPLHFSLCQSCVRSLESDFWTFYNYTVNDISSNYNLKTTRLKKLAHTGFWLCAEKLLCLMFLQAVGYSAAGLQLCLLSWAKCRVYLYLRVHPGKLSKLQQLQINDGVYLYSCHMCWGNAVQF